MVMVQVMVQVKVQVSVKFIMVKIMGMVRVKVQVSVKFIMVKIMGMVRVLVMVNVMDMVTDGRNPMMKKVIFFNSLHKRLGPLSWRRRIVRSYWDDVASQSWRTSQVFSSSITYFRGESWTQDFSESR